MVRRFLGSVEGAPAGEARFERRHGLAGVEDRLWLKRGELEWSGSFVGGPDGAPRGARSKLRLGGADRELVAVVEPGGLRVEEQGRARRVAFGPSSELDAGHPLLWGQWLPSLGTVRVVRLAPHLEPSVAVDHFDVHSRGEDRWGRRVWIETRAGPVALWLDGDGLVARVRFRPGGPGAAREEWRWEPEVTSRSGS